IYNAEDCRALKSLVDELSKIQLSADTLSGVDYADKRKQPTTEISKEINSQFSTILRFAHFNYDKKKISFRQSIETNESAQDMKEKKKYAGHMAKQRIMNIEKKVKRIIKVERGKVCPGYPLKAGHRYTTMVSGL